MPIFRRWILSILMIVAFALPAHAQNQINAGNASTIRLHSTIGYSYINSASTAPNGTIAVGTGNGLWLFDAGYTNPRQIHQGAVNAIAWRADGSEFAGALVDGTVRVWDATTYQERLNINNAHLPAQPDKDQPTGATVVIWSFDHSQIISGGSDGMVHIWESHNGSSFFNLAGHTQPVTDLSVSLSGRLISASASELFVWNTMRGQAEPIGNYHSVASWSGDSRYILTQEGSNLVILDGDTFSVINTFPQTAEQLKADWSTRQGTSFTVIGAESPAVLILDAWLNIERGRIGEGVADAIAWNNNEVDLAVWQDGTLTVWSSLDGTQKSTLGGWDADTRSLAWVDANRIALTDGDGQSTVWNITQGAVESGSAPQLTASSTTPTLTAQIATSDQGNVLSIFNADGALLGQYPTPFQQSITDYGVAEIVANPAGDVIAGGVSYVNSIGDTVHAVVIWNAQTGAQLAQLSEHNAPVIALAFSPDGTQLATLDVNGAAYRWTVN